LAQRDSRHFLGGTNWVGRRVPYHCTANGKVLLAFGAVRLPNGNLEVLTPHTIVDRALLEDELRNARKRGYATAVDELEPGLSAGRTPSCGWVGARFERGDFLVPEMLIAARAMPGALDILRPLLAETGAKPIGTFVMGTVKGDVHDIGKNLVNIMLEGAGFTVYDLGVNVAPEKFVEQAEEHEPAIVGFSPVRPTTIHMLKQ